MSELIDRQALIKQLKDENIPFNADINEIINIQPTIIDAEEFQRLKEKDTPKKITHQATLLKCCTCPSCLNVVDEFEKFGDTVVRVEFEYCHFCGQKLDWD